MKRTIITILFSLSSMVGFSQAIDEVSLVVTGSGESKEIAVQAALRSAVEQAYGVFVSSNTTILNDELTKDEIATVSSGNIKSYQEIDSQLLEGSSWVVSVRAIVSTSSLASYAKARGASCEFAGAVFGANLKLMKLNQKNTFMAIDHMAATLSSLGENLFDYSIEIGSPNAYGSFNIDVNLYPNESTIAAMNFIYKTLKELSIDETTYDQMRSMELNPGSAWVCVGDRWEELYFYGRVDFESLRAIISRSLWRFAIEDNFGTVYKKASEGWYPKYHFIEGATTLGEDAISLDYYTALRYGYEERIGRLSEVPKRTFNDYTTRLVSMKAHSFIIDFRFIVLPGQLITTNNNRGKKMKNDPKNDQYNSSTISVSYKPLYTIRLEYTIPVEKLTRITEFKVISR